MIFYITMTVWFMSISGVMILILEGNWMKLNEDDDLFLHNPYPDDSKSDVGVHHSEISDQPRCQDA